MVSGLSRKNRILKKRVDFSLGVQEGKGGEEKGTNSMSVGVRGLKFGY